MEIRPVRASHCRIAPVPAVGQHEQIAALLAYTAQDSFAPVAELDAITMRNADAVEIAGCAGNNAPAQVVDEPVVDGVAGKPSIAAQAPLLRPGLDVEKDDIERRAAAMQIDQVLDDATGARGAVDNGQSPERGRACASGVRAGAAALRRWVSTTAMMRASFYPGRSWKAAAATRVGADAATRSPSGLIAPPSKLSFKSAKPAGFGALAITVSPPPVTAPATSEYLN
jgi:hypothetical protein